MLAAIIAALNGLAALPSLITQITNLVAAIEKQAAATTAYNNIQQGAQIQSEIKNSNTTAQNQAVAGQIQNLVSNS